MENTIKYAHTNLIARDWEALAKFYIDVFGCKPVYPKRDLSGQWLDKLTLIDNAKIQGIHLSLPGYEEGPTLEIFEYSPTNLDDQLSLNALGFRHIAFQVDNVELILDKVIQCGGKLFGEVQRRKYPELNSLLTITYVKDPEGNYIELQNWCECL
jgi:predicted enzyme related to lactoylglutathione lyase